MDKVLDTTNAHIAAVERAEQRVRDILSELEEETGATIESVDVDTRNFSGLRTEIFLTSERRA